MLVVIQKIFSIFVIMGVGYGVSKFGILPKESKSVLSALLIYLTCPCMIIASTTSLEISKGIIGDTIWTMVLSTITILVFVLISRVLSKHIFHMENEASATMSYSMGSNNTGFFGFPVSLAVFGESVLYIFVIQNIILGLYLYLFGVVMMEAFTTGGKMRKENVISILKNVCMWSSVLGTAMLFAGIKLPEILYSPMQMLGDATTPLAMILVGCMLSECDFKEIIRDKNMVILSLVKMFVFPFVAFLIVNWLPISTTVKIGICFACVFPIAVMTAPMADSYGHDGKQAATSVGFTTLLSIVSLPLFASLLTTYYGW